MPPTLGYTIAGGSTATTAPLPVQSTQASLTADYLPMYSAAGVDTVAINLSNLLGISSQPVSINDPQTLTQKTLGNSNTYTAKDTSFTLQNASSTTKQAQFLLSGITAGQTRIFTLPNYNGTLATLAGTESLSNKTLVSPTISAPAITNATITADVYAGYTDSDTGILYGISVTNGAISSALSLTSTLAVTGASTLSGALTVGNTISSTGQLSVQTSTAPPAAGANTSGIKFSSTANLGLYWGSGAPTFSAGQGSLYLRTDGSSSSTRAYMNSTGSTTWVAVTTAS
jgi:hypothetical protein